MNKIMKNGLFVIALSTLAFACNDTAKDDNVDGMVDSTAVTEPTMDEAMNTSGDTATVVRTDSTAMQEAKQMGSEAAGAVEGAASDVKQEVK